MGIAPQVRQLGRSLAVLTAGLIGALLLLPSTSVADHDQEQHLQ